jgi:hypothetical protein
LVLSEREEMVLLAPELETNRGEMKALRSEKMGALNDQCRTLKRFQSLAENYDQSDWESKRLEKLGRKRTVGDVAHTTMQTLRVHADFEGAIGM